MTRTPRVSVRGPDGLVGRFIADPDGTPSTFGTIARSSVLTRARAGGLWLRCAMHLTDDYRMDAAHNFGQQTRHFRALLTPSIRTSAAHDAYDVRQSASDFRAYAPPTVGLVHASDFDAGSGGVRVQVLPDGRWAYTFSVHSNLWYDARFTTPPRPEPTDPLVQRADAAEDAAETVWMAWYLSAPVQTALAAETPLPATPPDVIAAVRAAREAREAIARARWAADYAAAGHDRDDDELETGVAVPRAAASPAASPSAAVLTH